MTPTKHSTTPTKYCRFCWAPVYYVSTSTEKESWYCDHCDGQSVSTRELLTRLDIAAQIVSRHVNDYYRSEQERLTVRPELKLDGITTGRHSSKDGRLISP